MVEYFVSFVVNNSFGCGKFTFANPISRWSDVEEMVDRVRAEYGDDNKLHIAIISWQRFEEEE